MGLSVGAAGPLVQRVRKQQHMLLRQPVRVADLTARIPPRTRLDYSHLCRGGLALACHNASAHQSLYDIAQRQRVRVRPGVELAGESTAAGVGVGVRQGL